MSVEVLVFEVEQCRFAIRAADVREVLRAVTLAPVPTASAGVEGVINLRGAVVPVVDVRRVFQLALRPIQHTDHLIVVRIQNRDVAIRVDRALDLVDLKEGEIEAKNAVLPQLGAVSTSAQTPLGVVFLLDVGELISHDEPQTMQIAGQKSLPTGEMA